MKRSAYDDDDNDDGWGESGDTTVVYDGSLSGDGRTMEKRQRSVELPRIIGPFTFAPDAPSLQQALLPLNASDRPGVYRVQTRASAPLRLWVLHTGFNGPLDTDSRTILGSIQYKCIFLFDTRTATSKEPVSAELRLDWLSSAPAVQKYGAIVSKRALDMPYPFSLPYIQDPTGAIMAESRVYEYLGPTAVCIQNGEVLGTVMLRRSPADVLQTLDLWD